MWVGQGWPARPSQDRHVYRWPFRALARREIEEEELLDVQLA